MAVVGKGSRTANATRTAQGTEDVNFTLPNNTDHIILGCGVGDDNGDRMRGAPDTPRDFRLEFRKGADAFANVTTTSAVRLGATDLVQGNAVVVGERLSTGLFGSYIDGVECETANPNDRANEVRDDTTEHQYSLDFNFAVASTQYDFRVFHSHDGTGGGNFVTYISITTAAAGGLSIPVAMANYRRQHERNR